MTPLKFLRHLTAASGHLIRRKNLWLEPTCGSHMTGLGGARAASDQLRQRRRRCRGGLRRPCLPLHWGAPRPSLPNIGPPFVPTDILSIRCNKLDECTGIDIHENLFREYLFVIIIWHVWEAIFCKVTSCNIQCYFRFWNLNQQT